MFPNSQTDRKLGNGKHMAYLISLATVILVAHVRGAG
jgi:hypothetical protein